MWLRTESRTQSSGAEEANSFPLPDALHLCDLTAHASRTAGDAGASASDSTLSSHPKLKMLQIFRAPSAELSCARAEECKLHLPEGSKGLDDDFVKEFNAKVTLALKARLPDWTERLDTWTLS